MLPLASLPLPPREGVMSRQTLRAAASRLGPSPGGGGGKGLSRVGRRALPPLTLTLSPMRRGNRCTPQRHGDFRGCALYLESFTSVNSASTTFSSWAAPGPAEAPPAPPSAAADSAPPPAACACAYITSPSFCDALPNASALASSAAFVTSLSFRPDSASLTADSIFERSSPSILSPYSVIDFFTLCTSASSALRDCTVSSSTRSSSACVSASLTIAWISPSDNPELALIVILFSLPVALSLADTCRMPLASMSNVTSICGVPRGDGGMPSRLNWPRLLLPPATSRSPCSTWIVTAPWLSSAVENTWFALVGIVVFFWISLVITPPSVSKPSDNGVTSSSSTSLRSPASTDAWMAAPTATASSGFTSRRGSLPKNALTASCTFGIRVMPPTRITSAMSESLTPASLIATRQGSTVREISSSTNDSSLARVIFIDRCFGPLASAVMYGRLISVCCRLESSIFAFSAVSLSRCSASLSPFRSTPDSFLNSVTM